MRGLLVFGAILGILTNSAFVSAAEPMVETGRADAAEVRFQLGNEALDRGRYREALSHFFTSYDLAPNANVLVNIALCYQGLKAHVEAYRYFTESLRSKMPKKERDAIERARERARKHIAVLHITSEPSSARIYLGRKDLGTQGTTPRTLAVNPQAANDSLVVIVEADNHKTHRQELIQLEPGSDQAVHVTLEPILSTLVLEGRPARFEVEIDGQKRGVATDGRLTVRVPTGERNIRLSAPGHLSQLADKVKITEYGPNKLSVALAFASGAVVVNTDEPDARVFLDGQLVGFAPTVIERVPAGAHSLSVCKQGFVCSKHTIDLKPNERLPVTARLAVEDTVQGASGVRESVLNAPASVSLLTAREIQAFGYTTVADAIVGMRGMYLTNDTTYNVAGVRGYSPFGQYGNRVQVLVDGHRMNDDWLASSFIGYDLITSLHDIEKVEIIRGPGSAIYGSGAFFGVINLVTPRHVDAFKVTAGMSMVGEGGIRTYGKVEAPLGSDGGVRLYAGGIYRQPRSFERVLPGPDPLTTSTIRADGLGEEFGGSAMLKAWLGDFTFKAGMNDRTQQIGTGAYETIFGDSRTRVQDDRYFAELKYNPQLSHTLTLSARLFYDSFGYTGHFAYPVEDDGLMKERYRGHVIGTEVRADYSPTNWARFTLGGEYQFHLANEALGQSASGVFLREKHPYRSAAAFGIAHVDIFDWWSLQAGARLDARFVSGLATMSTAWLGTVPPAILEDVCAFANPENPVANVRDVSFISLNPRIAMLFRPWQDGTLKLMFGRAFRGASIYELTYNDGCLTQSPSPGLTEEAVYTGDMEYIHKLPEDFWFTLSSSLSVLQNGIQQFETDQPVQVDGESRQLLYYTHIGRPTHALTAEVELRKEFRRGWMLAAHYGYQLTKQSVDGALLQGLDVPNAPTHLAGAKLVLPLFNRRVRLASRLYVELGRKDRELNTLEPTVLWDLVFSGELPGLKLTYSAGIRNILNWTYDHPVGEELDQRTIAQPGTSASVDLHFQF